MTRLLVNEILCHISWSKCYYDNDRESLNFFRIQINFVSLWFIVILAWGVWQGLIHGKGNEGVDKDKEPM